MGDKKNHEYLSDPTFCAPTTNIFLNLKFRNLLRIIKICSIMFFKKTLLV